MRTAVLLTCLLAALGGCGGGDDKEQIRQLMTQLRQVQESGDAERACEQVYVVRERGREEEQGEEEGGPECREAFERAVEACRRDVRDLETELVRVNLEGDEGTAVLHTRLVRRDGSTLERDVPYDVVKTEEGWRVRIAGEG
jgi:hypothetical protein